MEDKKQTRRNLILFPLGTVGRDMVYSLVTNFLLTFVLFTRSLTAAQLSAITAIMVGARTTRSWATSSSARARNGASSSPGS